MNGREISEWISKISSWDLPLLLQQRNTIAEELNGRQHKRGLEMLLILEVATRRKVGNFKRSVIKQEQTQEEENKKLKTETN